MLMKSATKALAGLPKVVTCADNAENHNQVVYLQAEGQEYFSPPIEHVALGPPSGGQQNRGRVSGLMADLSGPIS
ncbi:hypothetical protein [Bradyrhizobium cenepequi]|uniref:hypothetical protein n=1 Tax=Bradyrhizobium cenepequi TaxID=2821403 RepID=UPI001CE30857|nr:hypothetical protein [Bradyrhizobium cenepequi]MCA6106723.1 hypothetical protein [Bradyrhizobium cenepequi]